MKHCILVKFNDGVDLEKVIYEVKNIFDSLIEIEGINFVEYKQNCIDRSNRYDFLIMIDMQKEALDIYDTSLQHQIWKKEYSKYVFSKAIFDFE